MQLPAFVKKRPVTIAAVVIGGGLLLFFAMRGGPQQAAVSVATGPSEAQIAAALQAQQMQIQAASQTQAIQAQLEGRKLEIQGNLSLATLQAQLEDARSSRETSAQLKMAEFAASIQQASIAGQTAIGMTTAQASADLARYQGMSQLVTAEANAYYTKAMADLAPVQLDHATGIRLAEIKSVTDLAIIEGTYAAQIAQHQAQGMIGVAQQQKKAATANMWGNVAGGLIKAFL